MTCSNHRPSLMVRRPDYTRPVIEYLFAALFDPHAAYGSTAAQAPPPDMPRSTPNKARSNTYYAHLADARIAWTTTPLTDKERRAIFLRHVLDWTNHDIARHEGVTRQTIEKRLFTGIGKLVATLNGAVFSEAHSH
ncbi:sigma factor-like helix-turn-helix DNA-binding protein [Kribbella deserti]|uniref:Sigma factor-like helix-turn-helix DNA-binding protein n=1 Tax=Kribbella deserti TaxID=1926257 RepID=A0ABV6QGS0_9ACTN